MYIWSRSDMESIKDIVLDEFPFMVLLDISWPSAARVEGSDNMEVGLDEQVLDAIFAYPSVTKSFTDRIRKVLDIEHGLTSIPPTVNKNSSSIYIGCFKRIGDTVFEVRVDLGFVLRVSNPPQSVPYSDNVAKSRESIKAKLVQWVQQSFSLTKSSDAPNNIELPDVDFSIVLRTPIPDDSERNFGDDVEGLIQFIASKMSSYVDNLVEARNSAEDL